MTVVALLPPDHIESRCCRAQDELFRTYGLVSSRALPPMIPVGWVTVGERASLSLLHGHRLNPITLGETVRFGDWIVVETTPSETMKWIRDTLVLQEGPANDSPSFPIDAVILAATDNGNDEPFSLSGDDLNGLVMRTATVALVEIAWSAGTPWFASVAWRIVEQCKITALG